MKGLRNGDAACRSTVTFLSCRNRSHYGAAKETRTKRLANGESKKKRKKKRKVICLTARAITKGKPVWTFESWLRCSVLYFLLKEERPFFFPAWRLFKQSTHVLDCRWRNISLILKITKNKTTHRHRIHISILTHTYNWANSMCGWQSYQRLRISFSNPDILTFPSLLGLFLWRYSGCKIKAD